MSTQPQIERALHKFLIETTGDASLKNDSDLLASGLLDSLTMMDLVVFIEIEFQQKVPMDEMRPEQFRTIGAVAELVNRLQTRTSKNKAA